ncbi:ribulose-phosphate 3-epimerase [Candidatus Gracilibacteria bacterium]|nr:ribulose-phosphate 3-epimerase [Candidatus Gracilibacteria bacterium]MCF7818990.1 ribulose-phosphate 3-epimerase [Candidatus Gracilibacteria bacterium]
MKISPSILNADFSRLNEEVKSIASADRIHLDIMDGKYVPQATFRASDISKITFPVPTEAHLMVEDPESYFEEFQELGCEGITFHIETQDETKTLQLLRKLQRQGIRAGICIDGFTPVSELSDAVLEAADLVLVMSVKAGKGGQDFMPESLHKIQQLRERLFVGEIEVDGGVTLGNVGNIASAGADIVVVGSFLMKQERGKRKKVIAQFQEV